jgi:hypothetical protein
MGDGVMAVGIAAAWPHHSQPETAISLKHQDGFGSPLAMGFQQRHAELFGHFMTLGTHSQSPQQGVDLGERHEAGTLGIRYQDQSIQPLHLQQQLLNRGQQCWEGESQNLLLNLSFIF